MSSLESEFTTYAMAVLLPIHDDTRSLRSAGECPMWPCCLPLAAWVSIDLPEVVLVAHACYTRREPKQRSLGLAKENVIPEAFSRFACCYT